MKIRWLIGIILISAMLGCFRANVIPPSSIAMEERKKQSYDCSVIASQTVLYNNGHPNPILQHFEYQRCLKAKYGWEEIK